MFYCGQQLQRVLHSLLHYHYPLCLSITVKLFAVFCCGGLHSGGVTSHLHTATLIQKILAHLSDGVGEHHGTTVVRLLQVAANQKPTVCRAVLPVWFSSAASSPFSSSSPRCPPPPLLPDSDDHNDSSTERYNGCSSSSEVNIFITPQLPSPFFLFRLLRVIEVIITVMFILRP